MTRRLERALWGTAFAGAIALVAMLGMLRDGPADTPVSVSTVARSLGSPRTDLGDLTLRVVATDPFRLERRPSSIPFGAVVVGEAQRPREPIPAPTVVGVLGPPWRAVLEGLVGVQGSVLLAEGDTIAGFHVVAVRPDSVVLRSKDTTWTLGIRRTW